MKIDDHKSTGSDSQKDAPPVGGRKPAWESHATEFRQRLMVWKQTPDSMRPSLRALAGELGTTHQLLTYYLAGLDKWRAKEESKRIRACAKVENRALTLQEALRTIVVPGLLDQLWQIKQAAKRGPLNSHQLKMLKLLAQRGYPGAQEVLEKCRPMTKEEEKQARADSRARFRAERAAAMTNKFEGIKEAAGRGPLDSHEVKILEAFARARYPGARELLRKCSPGAPDDH